MSLAISFNYCVYGQRLSSCVPIPFLKSSSPSTNTDVQIDFSGHPSRAQEWSLISQRPGRELSESESHLRLRYFPREGPPLIFVLRKNGKHIEVHRPKGVPERDAEAFLIGRVLGYVLLLQKRLSLHASALEWNDRTFLLMGASGKGKSTLASTLIKQGAKLITDDIAALQVRNGRIFVSPGYPSLRLSQESLEFLGYRGPELPAVSENGKKRYWPVNDSRFCSEPRPISAVYVLTGSTSESRERIRVLGQRDALVQAIGNFYIKPFSDFLREAFQLAGALAQSVPFWELDRPSGGPQAMKDFVVNHIESSSFA